MEAGFDLAGPEPAPEREFPPLAEPFDSATTEAGASTAFF
jgi:hypothetical protein